jgi:hypothetical protein
MLSKLSPYIFHHVALCVKFSHIVCENLTLFLSANIFMLKLITKGQIIVLIGQKPWMLSKT